MPIYDISRTISPALAVWPGDVTFAARPTMTIRSGCSCNVAAITLSVHTGAHTDAPYHFDEAGPTIDQVPLEKYMGPATVLSVPHRPRIEVRDIQDLDYGKIKRLLFKTGAGSLADEIFPTEFMYLAKETADFLGRHGVRLVGTDAPSVDAFESKTLEAHKALLRHEVAILEGINLSDVPDGEYELIALPLKLKGCDASPVRAVLRR